MPKHRPPFTWVVYRSQGFQLRCVQCGWTTSIDVTEDGSKRQATKHYKTAHYRVVA